MEYPYHVIDMENNARSEHFKYFSAMQNPYVGVTCEVEITDFYRAVKESTRPFFLSLLWCAAQAANSVPELRRRILNGGVIEYDWCPTSHTVAREDGSYGYCPLDGHQELDEFLRYALPLHEAARQGAGIEEDDPLPLFFVSCVPWLHYTSLVQPTPVPADSNPRITFGKYVRRGAQYVIPVTLLCHHALVDGLHISRFYQALDEKLNAL